MSQALEYEEVEELTPDYFLCGAGGDLNCEHFDNIDGCLCCAEYFGDDKCQAPCNIEEDNL